MGFGDFKDPQCVCDFLNGLGDLKTSFIALIDAGISLLTTVKAAIALWPEDPADRLHLIELQAELNIWETISKPIDTPFVVLQSYFSLYGDCSGVASAVKAIKGFRDTILGPVEEREDEINDMIESLDLEASKVQRLDDIIDQLQAVKDAIDLCGQLGQL
jgi:hypothetical protein